jgi:hypothetical protein
LLRHNFLSLRERARVRGCKNEFFLLLFLILTFSRREKEPIREPYNKKLASALKL